MGSETTQCVHDYRYVSSESFRKDDDIFEVAKVICIKCGVVKKQRVIEERNEK